LFVFKIKLCDNIHLNKKKNRFNISTFSTSNYERMLDLNAWKSAWIVGSSNIKRDFAFARGTFEGSNLDLRRRDCSLWWQGKGGMY
jgi:hypothetical protein